MREAKVLFPAPAGPSIAMTSFFDSPAGAEWLLELISCLHYGLVGAAGNGEILSRRRVALAIEILASAVSVELVAIGTEIFGRTSGKLLGFSQPLLLEFQILAAKLLRGCGFRFAGGLDAGQSGDFFPTHGQTEQSLTRHLGSGELARPLHGADDFSNPRARNHGGEKILDIFLFGGDHRLQVTRD